MMMIEASRLIHDLERIEADMLAILATQARNPEAVAKFARRSAETAAKLAQQIADMRVAEAVALASAKPKRPRPIPAPKKEAAIGPLDFSGTFASMLLSRP